MPSRAECLQVLGLPLDASGEDIRQAYLDNMKAWHPDRHSHDPGLASRAAERAKRINSAYEFLQRDSSQRPTASPTSRPQKPPSPSTRRSPPRREPTRTTPAAREAPPPPPPSPPPSPNPSPRTSSPAPQSRPPDPVLLLPLKLGCSFFMLSAPVAFGAFFAYPLVLWLSRTPTEPVTWRYYTITLFWAGFAALGVGFAGFAVISMLSPMIDKFRAWRKKRSTTAPRAKCGLGDLR